MNSLSSSSYDTYPEGDIPLTNEFETNYTRERYYNWFLNTQKEWEMTQELVTEDWSTAMSNTMVVPLFLK